MLRIHDVKIRKDMSNEEVFNFIIQKYNIRKEDILDWNISKKSIDARNKHDIYYVYSIDLKVKSENKYSKFQKVTPFSMPIISVKNISSKKPIIVGCGPSGLFCALTMVQNGLSPIIIEQGDCVDDRKKVVEIFFKTGKLNPLSNVQFGEGGAGTFSDGKLTSGISSPLCRKVLQEFVNFGAPEEILYLSKPHIGTDNLINILKNIRKYIISKGGTFYFNTKVIDFNIQDNKVKSVICKSFDNIKEFEASHVILAIGHSARDTFEKLYEKGIEMEKKNFSVGLRIEHLQEEINEAQYGKITNLRLPPADYKLVYHSPSGRSCYTFCMCPGGVVVASSSEKDTIVTNGMSYFARNR